MSPFPAIVIPGFDNPVQNQVDKSRVLFIMDSVLATVANAASELCLHYYYYCYYYNRIWPGQVSSDKARSAPWTPFLNLLFRRG